MPPPEVAVFPPLLMPATALPAAPTQLSAALPLPPPASIGPSRLEITREHTRSHEIGPSRLEAVAAKLGTCAAMASAQATALRQLRGRLGEVVTCLREQMEAHALPPSSGGAIVTAPMGPTRCHVLSEAVRALEEIGSSLVDEPSGNPPVTAVPSSELVPCAYEELLRSLSSSSSSHDETSSSLSHLCDVASLEKQRQETARHSKRQRLTAQAGVAQVAAADELARLLKELTSSLCTSQRSCA